MEVIEIVLLMMFLLVFVKIVVVDKMPVYKNELISDISDLVDVLTTGKGFIISLLILYPLVLYVHHKIGKLIFKILDKRREEREELTRQTAAISTILDTKLERLNFREVLELVNELKDSKHITLSKKKLFQFQRPICKKLEQAEYKIVELNHEEKLRKLKTEKEDERKKLEKIKNEQMELEQDKQRIKYNILTELEAREKHVFIKSDLNPEEIEALEEDGFTHANEYCVFEKKIISVLVKPTMHHSIAHTFLVWSTGRLLESLSKVTHIDEHNTRDADLTFKCKKNLYAVEIETGTLLSKKAQLRNKVSYLNRKYPNRWTFVVSNKNLASKYSRFGPVSIRKDVEKKLRKMLKIAI